MPACKNLHSSGFQLTAISASIAAIGAFLPIAAQAQSTTIATEHALPTVTVIGRSSFGTYQAADVSGTKTELPLRELPQSVRVMTRQTIADLGATRLDDVLDYVGGVSRQNSFGGLWDNFAIRGMAGNENTGMPTLLNGFSANRGFNAPRDMAAVERIEFLKGPAAALYGTSEPGGTLNIVTKKPRWTSGHSVEAYGGSFDTYRAAVDTTGPVGADVAYRLNAAVEKRGSFRDHVDTERQVVAPAATWQVSPSTTLEYSGEWLHHKTPLDRGVVAVNNQLGTVPRERFLGEPNDGDVTVQNMTHQLALEHEWSTAWRTRVAFSYRTTQMNGFSTEPTSLLPDGRTLTRQRRHRDYDTRDVSAQAEMIGKGETGGLKHEVLVGAEAYRFTYSQEMLRVNPTAGAPYAIDIFNPVYGQALPTPLPNTDMYEYQRNIAFYAQDAVTLGRQWRLLAGARIDNYDQHLSNRRTGVTTSQAQTELSPRIGLSWLPTKNWTVYASAGTSLRPNSGADVSGTSFEPEKGRALELGAKWESADQRLGATAALFDIRKRNAVTSDPANPGFSITAGEVTSRGFEFDLGGQVTQRWRLHASLVLNDAEVSRDNTLEVGGRVLNVPRVNGSVLAVYENTLGGVRFGLGGGVTHVGERLGQARTQAPADQATPAFELPAYTTAKLVGYWRLSDALRVSLDVDNLFDKTYYVSSYSRVWVSPGSARSVTLGLQAKF